MPDDSVSFLSGLNFCTYTKSNLYFASFLATIFNEPDVQIFQEFSFLCLCGSKKSAKVSNSLCNIYIMLYSCDEEPLFIHADKLENQPLSAHLDSLMNTFTALLLNGNFPHLQLDGTESRGVKEHII
jgi:hypothetical protein